MKRFLAFIFLLASICASAQDDGTLQSRLSRDTILIGDQIEWLFDFGLQEGEELFLEKPSGTPVQGVETIREMSLDTISAKKGRMDLRGRVILTSFDSGSYILPDITAAIRRADGDIDTLLFEGPVLEVTTIPVDTATFQPYDIKGQIRYPLTVKEMLPWFGILLIVAAIIWFIARLVRRRRENRTFFGKPVVKDPPHIVALRSLEKTRGQKLWQNNKQKQFYTQVTDALRQYMADRYDIPALEETSAEIFQDLRNKQVEPQLMEKVKELFTTADYVKFAKHNASDLENEEAIPTAVRFVNETYMQQVEGENTQNSKEAR